MRKILFTFSCIALCSPFSWYGSFLSDPTPFDLYKKIDGGYYDLEMKFIQKELQWWKTDGSIIDDLNMRAKQNELKECFNWDISAKQMEQIYEDKESMSILYGILKECFDENNDTLSTQLFTQYYQLISESYQEWLQRAKDKVDNIYKIWRIGMYSDGVIENSPFDLMQDIADINSIIFEEEIPYDGVNNYDLGKLILNTLQWSSSQDAYTSSLYQRPSGGYFGNTAPFDPNICIVDNNNSWLNDDFYRDIIGLSQRDDEENSENQSQSPIVWSSGYKKTKDNSIWPCNNFFCILVDFVIYNHKLLGWGTNLSIEGILKRSNDHLKKFAGTSLIQSRMTTNNFQLWLKDLNLPDIFHIWVQVSYKPVPLLNVNISDYDESKDGQKDWENNEFEYKNLLTTYYKNLWLDYARANDLDLFEQKQAEVKSIYDSSEQAITNAGNRFDTYQNYITQIRQQNNYISENIIDTKIIQEDMEWFYYRYIELESFSQAMMDYAIQVKGIIDEMNKIPQWQ